MKGLSKVSLIFGLSGIAVVFFLSGCESKKSAREVVEEYISYAETGDYLSALRLQKGSEETINNLNQRKSKYPTIFAFQSFAESEKLQAKYKDQKALICQEFGYMENLASFDVAPGEWKQDGKWMTDGSAAWKERFDLELVDEKWLIRIVSRDSRQPLFLNNCDDV